MCVATGLVGACASSSGSTSNLSLPAGLRVHVDTVWYPVRGATRRDWLASARASAEVAGVPRPFIAHTSSSMRWSYASSQSTPRGCAARSPLIEVDVQYVIPQLHPDSTASSDDLQEWERHTRALWRHEEGHAVRALRAGTELRDSLLVLRTPTCAELSPAITRATTQVLTRYRLRQVEYDERTQHGVRQGVVLRMPGSRMPIDTTFRDTLP